MTTPTRILLIDDDAVDRAAVRRALAKSGLKHSLTEAPGGDEGLRLAAEETFDCVLLDYRLPGVDTFALLKTLLAAEGQARAVLMLTGEADPELATRARKLAATRGTRQRPALAPRERQLIGFVRKGLRNREIAAELGVTEGTVKVYLHAIFDKLDVSNRTELAIRADEFLSG